MAAKRPGIKTASAKAKGRNFQKYVVSLILKHFPWLGEGDVESRSMGSSGVDIMLSPLGRRTFPLSIECKRTKKTPSRQELEQARYNAYSLTAPCVVWCAHGSGPQKAVIMFDLEDFINWYKDVSKRELQITREQQELINAGM